MLPLYALKNRNTFSTPCTQAAHRQYFVFMVMTVANGLSSRSTPLHHFQLVSHVKNSMTSHPWLLAMFQSAPGVSASKGPLRHSAGDRTNIAFCLSFRIPAIGCACWWYVSLWWRDSSLIKICVRHHSWLLHGILEPLVPWATIMTSHPVYWLHAFYCMTLMILVTPIHFSTSRCDSFFLNWDPHLRNCLSLWVQMPWLNISSVNIDSRFSQFALVQLASEPAAAASPMSKNTHPDPVLQD